jgi:hypothetical protein
MRAITLQQPWATLVARGLKKMETRSWWTGHVGWMAIHAGGNFPPKARALERELASEGILTDPPVFTAVVGYCWSGIVMAAPDARPSAFERRVGDYGVGRWAWVLEDAVAIEPIACKGQLGLWTLPNPVIQALRKQIPK